ncbi:MAG: hypothetical protein A2Y07_00030 [Planctomycetes bacterium GWF2_50_10]|nr:MAG: hypothetical protein A2Y07_00030 [Planctomycetes bacterium GWF2_50_10]
MLSAVVVLIFAAGFGIQQYLKGGVAKAALMFISAIIAVAVSFNFYELVGSLGKGFIGDKAYAAGFALLFMFTMILLSEVFKRLIKETVDMGFWPDRIGGFVFGAITGLICAGMFLILLGLIPYGVTKHVYARFEEPFSNPPRANKALLNADGFVSGLFSYMSKAGFAGTSNFAVVNADFTDKVFLNQYFATIENPASMHALEGVITAEPNAVIKAPEKLRTYVGDEGKTQLVESVSGKTLYIVAAQINSSSLEISEETSATGIGLGQVRLVTVPKGTSADAPGVSGEAVYPTGIIDSKGLLKEAKLGDVIPIEEISTGAKFAFYVPVDRDPAVIEIKLNGGDTVRPPAAVILKQ